MASESILRIVVLGRKGARQIAGLSGHKTALCPDDWTVQGEREIVSLSRQSLQASMIPDLEVNALYDIRRDLQSQHTPGI